MQIRAEENPAVAEIPAVANVGDRVTFSFGRNWCDFVEHHLTPERERSAISSITQFLEMDSLAGRSFLDIGCGSGLFSLAAYRLGCTRIVSVDIDPFSVKSCERLRERVGKPPNWDVVLASVLDNGLISQLEKADIVYAWGSLHHTGNMWQAIRNAASLVNKDGLFYIAIYNKVFGRKGSDFWLKVKRLYNRSSPLGKRGLELVQFTRDGLLPKLVAFQNPMTLFTEYPQGRGMNYWTDIRDWLGGYPYEFATVDEVWRFCTRELGLELTNLRATNTLGNSEYLFRRTR